MSLRRIIAAALLSLTLVGACFGFEIDGFRSGMSVSDAEAVVARLSFDSTVKEGNSIMLSDHPSRPNPRTYSLSFCLGRLSQLQKHINPTFATFVRLASEETQRRGPPTTAWATPSPATSRVEANSVVFVWKENREYLVTEYIEWVLPHFHGQLS
jgi:hypothetical protein